MYYIFSLLICASIIIFLCTHYYRRYKNSHKEVQNFKRRKNEFIHITESNKNNKANFKVLSYNILCQKFMKRKNRRDLNLDYRMNIIIEEISSLNPDIFCLQETNLNTYRKYFLTNFPSYIFEYGENYGSNFINLIGIKKSRFKIVYRKNMELWHIDVDGNRGIFHLILEDQITNETLSVYNVHFPWRPKYEIEKCYFLNAISQDIFTHNIKHVIIAGDFNSIPNSLLLRLVYFKDLIFEMDLLQTERHFDNFISKFELSKHFDKYKNSSLLNKKIDKSHKFEFLLKILKEILTNEKHEKFGEVFKNMAKLYKTYNLKSAYDSYKFKLTPTFRTEKQFLSFLSHHPNYTNFTESFKNTIDYIFHSKFIETVKILKLPEREELSLEHFLPSSRYPSDHLKIFAEFTYI